MDEHDGGDDWDDVPAPQSRSDRIQRITSPDGTLQRPPPSSHHPHSTSSLARSAQQQQIQIAMALMQQQQLQMGLRDGLYEHHQPPPSHIASLRRQAQIMALQAARSGSLPRDPHQQMFSIPPSPTSSRGIRYRSPATSLPPTSGPLRPVMSPNLSSARRLRQDQQQLDPRLLDSLSRRNIASMGPYWGQQHEKGPFDPFQAAQQQQAIYSGDGSTSSYARVNHTTTNHRQTYPPQLSSSASQNIEPLYNLQHDENNSLTSQKTSRTQASMLTKSAPTPSGSGSGASGSGSTPLQPKQSSEATGSTTISASAKYAEYISNLQKYQHPPPSKRHVTFIKYRGRQCTIAMLVVFAILVIGLVVAPVVYFTAFANKASPSSSAPPTQLTNVINGQVTLDTTHGAYADLLTDPGRPPDVQLKRIQRDMEILLKDVLRGSGGFAENDINSVVVSQPQRPDAHQIFLRFQVILKNSQPLDAAESKTSKAFASATTTDNVGMRLKDIPIVANSLFFRAVAVTPGATASLADTPSSGISDAPSGSSDSGSRSFDSTMQLDPGSAKPTVSRGPSLNSVSSSISITKPGVTPPPPAASPPAAASADPIKTTSSLLAPAPSTSDTTIATTMGQPTTSFLESTPKTTPQTPSSVARTDATTVPPQPTIAPDSDDVFGVGVGVHARKTTTASAAASSGGLVATFPAGFVDQRPLTTLRPVAPPPVPQMTKAMETVGPAISDNGLQSGSRVQSNFNTGLTGNRPPIDNVFNGPVPLNLPGGPVNQIPVDQSQIPLPGNNPAGQNPAQFGTTPSRVSPDPALFGSSPFRDFTPPPPTMNGNQNRITVTNGWTSFADTSPPRLDVSTSPQFVQQFNPNLPGMPGQPSVFNLNMQNQPSQGNSNFNPQNQPPQGNNFNPQNQLPQGNFNLQNQPNQLQLGNFNPQNPLQQGNLVPFQGQPEVNPGNNFQTFSRENGPQQNFPLNGNRRPDQFNRDPDNSFNGGGFRLTNSPQQLNSNSQPAFQPVQSFRLNAFAQDDASASSPASTILDATASSTSQFTTASQELTSSLAATTVPDSSLPTSTSPDQNGQAGNQSQLTVEKREFSSLPSGANMPNSPVKPAEEAQEFPEFADTSVAPVLTSKWGNWTEWGACSAPQCSNDGFQSRTRFCMTSIGGATPVPDRDASCMANGGQAIEARSCVCEQPVTTDNYTEDATTADSTVDTGNMTTTDDLSDDYFSTNPSTPATTTTTTANKIPSYMAWSDWTDWSDCSIAPCHPNGIQTRHRTCQADGQTVADQPCLEQLDGASAETQPCRCPTTTMSPMEVRTTTATFVRPGGQFMQPQRTFSLQVQHRPIQRRPTTKLPGTCSAFEKPCNNGQCILSYRICDGFPDCADGSDEPLGCGRCFSGEFKCTNGRCISETLVCDGSDNCGDGSDEYFC